MADSHGEFVGQFGWRGWTKKAASFTSHVVGGIDGFLYVAASFLQDLSHLASHIAGVLFLAFDEHFGGFVDDFSAAGSRHQAPLGKSPLGGIHSGIHIFLTGLLEDADHVASVRRITVFESFSGRGLDPFAVYEVLKDLGFSGAAEDSRTSHGFGGHKSSLRMLKTFHATTQGEAGQVSE